jgi:hypothetical protein
VRLAHFSECCFFLPVIEMRAQSGGSDANWTGLGSGVSSEVDALAVSGGDLYAGGIFLTAGDNSANRIAKWDGSSWKEVGSGMNRTVFALTVSGSNVYAGGDFTNAGGNAANYIAKWDGSSWTTLGSGMNSTVFVLAVSGSNLYAGGFFATAGDNAANHIATWDGNSWTALGSGLDNGPNGGYVQALAVSGRDVYAVGEFGIAKWNGSSWSALGSGLNNFVRALTVSGSEVYAGGDFRAGDTSANYIAKWDGNSWSTLGSGMNTYVLALAMSGSDLYAGGDFTMAGGKVSAHIARAYLLPLPAISVLRSDKQVTVSWASADTVGFELEQADAPAHPASWVTNTTSVTDDGTNKSVTFPATNSPQFFRLSRP